MQANQLLTTNEMQRADALAVEAGVASLDLMEAAGRSVADVVQELAEDVGHRVTILCGPGNNGGDGFVAARLLKNVGLEVRVYLLGDEAAITGDAKAMLHRLSGKVAALSPSSVEDSVSDTDVIVDALFGAGLSRALTDDAADVVAAANASDAPVVSVDVPSGLDGNRGAADGPVIAAARTVTFFRLKPGHLLQPGRTLCGVTTVADIGTPDVVLNSIKPTTLHNVPATWRAQLPQLRHDGHKYDRGHAVVVSGPATQTGAARLAARGALRIGAGLVSVASPVDATEINASQLTTIMIESFASLAGLQHILSDKRKNAVLIGPGRGVVPETRDDVATVLQSGAATVLDADALTVFADHRNNLVDAIQAMPDRPVVITPHEGEFARLFPDLKGDKLTRARDAAALLNVVVVLKGSDTVIAGPHGYAAINDNAPATLATAGSGDVLAGLITGLLAQQMPAFEAACAAVWLHGAAADAFGLGLIAEDLPEQLPRVLRRLQWMT